MKPLPYIPTGLRASDVTARVIILPHNRLIDEVPPGALLCRDTDDGDDRGGDNLFAQ